MNSFQRSLKTPKILLLLIPSFHHISSMSNTLNHISEYRNHKCLSSQRYIVAILPYPIEFANHCQYQTCVSADVLFALASSVIILHRHTHSSTCSSVLLYWYPRFLNNYHRFCFLFIYSKFKPFNTFIHFCRYFLKLLWRLWYDVAIISKSYSLLCIAPCVYVEYVVFTRRYRPPDGSGLCSVFIDVSGVCPLYVRGMSDVCPPDGESRTQRRKVRRTVHRTEGGAIITRDVMTYIVMT